MNSDIVAKATQRQYETARERLVSIDTDDIANTVDPQYKRSEETAKA